MQIVCPQSALTCYKQTPSFGWHIFSSPGCCLITFVSRTIGAGAILSVGLLKMIEWEKMAKRFDIDGGVSGGQLLTPFHSPP